MSKKEGFVLLFFVALKFLLQSILIDPAYDLQRDEYLHLDQANHLAWGFTSVPPLTSWISFLIRCLGNGVFWIKFFPALFGVLTIVVVWLAVDELKGNLGAKVLAATCVLFSALLRINTLLQPNSFDILSWTTTFYFFIKYINTGKSKWVYLGAFFFALGFLNKYNIIFLMLGIFPALLITKQRTLFLKKEFYVAIGIVLLIISPNLIWQYQNHFPVFHHLHELSVSQLVHVSRILFLKNQLLFFTGSIIVIISALYALLFVDSFKKYRFLFWSFVFTLTIFTYLRAKDYYAIGLYPIYIAFGSVFLYRILDNKLGIFFKPVLLLFPILIFDYMINVAFPNKTPEYIEKNQDKYRDLGMLRWEDGKNHMIPQDYADMLGWKELASIVDSACESIDSPEKTLVLCDNYGQAGAINFYTRNNIHSVSFDADYLYWFDLHRKYKNLIRIKNRSERWNEMVETSPFFASSMILDSIKNKFAREFGTTVFIFKNSNVSINKRIEAELDDVKDIHAQW